MIQKIKVNITKNADLSAEQKLSSIVKICQRISKVSIYLLVFLLPLFFLPWTVSIFDFNKQAILILLVFISLFAWLLEILISRKFTFHLSWIHLPVAVLFLVYLLATIFSSRPYGSFWGWPLITSESLISLLCLTLVYFLVVNIFRRQEIYYLITLLMFSCFLAILYGNFQLFGKFLLPFDFTKASSFNTIGSVSSLGVFTAVLLPLIIILIIVSNKTFLRVIYILAAVFSGILLILINFPIAWWLVIAGCALVIVFGVQKRELFDNRWLPLPIFFLALALLCSLFKFQLPGLPLRPLEVFLNQRASLNIAWEALKENPILGSGPGTFVYNFSKYKNISFNQTSLWNLRFEAGSSKILTLLATTGVLGVLSFLALIGLFVFFGIKSLFLQDINAPKNDNDKFLGKWNLGIFISFLTLTAGYFLWQSNLTFDFLYFLLMGCFISTLSLNKKEFLLKPSSLITLGITFTFILVFIFGLSFLFLEGQRYVALASYLKGMRLWQEQKRVESLGFLERATRLDQKSDFYWRELSQAYLQSIDEVTKLPDLSQEEITQRVQFLIEKTVDSTSQATKINPEDVTNWSVRGFVYQNLIGVVNGSKDWAIKSYQEALRLEPTNPYFQTQAGISLLREVAFLSQDKTAEREKILEEAEAEFKKAIELKSDYALALFQLAMVYQAQGKLSAAVEELEKTKSAAPFDVGLAFQLGLVYYQNKDYQKARDELERAVSMNPNYSNALYFLGLTLDLLGEKNKALEKFEQVSLLNPDNLEVKKILENLKANRSALEGIVESVPPTIPIEEKRPEIEE